MAPSPMPTSVTASSGGANSSRNGAAGTTASRTAARQRGDSGTSSRIATPRTAGAEPTSSIARHESALTGTTPKYASAASQTKPKLAAAPSSPASSGREASGHASLPRATAPGQAP